MGSEKAWHCGGLVSQNMVNPRDWGDGGPVGANACVGVLVCEQSAGVLPPRLAGPSVESGVCATSVGIQPAGVKISE